MNGPEAAGAGPPRLSVELGTAEATSGVMTEDQAISTIENIHNHLYEMGPLDLGIFIGVAFDTHRQYNARDGDKQRFATAINSLVRKQINADTEEERKRNKFILCIDPNFTPDVIQQTLDRGAPTIRGERAFRYISTKINWEDAIFASPETLEALPVYNLSPPPPAPLSLPDIPGAPRKPNEIKNSNPDFFNIKEMRESENFWELHGWKREYTSPSHKWPDSIWTRIKEFNFPGRSDREILIFLNLPRYKFLYDELKESEDYWEKRMPFISRRTRRNESRYTGFGTYSGGAEPEPELYKLSFAFNDDEISMEFVYFIYFLQYGLKSNYPTDNNTFQIAIGKGKSFSTYAEHCSYETEYVEYNPEYMRKINRTQEQAKKIARVYQSIQNLVTASIPRERNAFIPVRAKIQDIYVVSTHHAHGDFFPKKNNETGVWWQYGERSNKKSPGTNEYTIIKKNSVDSRYLQNICEIHHLLYTLASDRGGDGSTFYINLSNEISVFKNLNAPITRAPSIVKIESYRTEFNRNEGKKIRYYPLIYEGERLPESLPANFYRTREATGGKRRKTRRQKRKASTRKKK